uniref:Uncharacterized protein n=1 Tax=viral metagenome TaxID=1070528 RepID=A0A6M3LSD9_9ZZZZ
MLWIIVDSNNYWLYYGRSSFEEALEEAKLATEYDPEATLYVFSVDSEIVIAPD